MNHDPHGRGESRDEGSARDRGSLGGGSLLALGINGVVGVGVFFAPSELAALVPGAGLLGVIAGTGLALVPVALAFAILGARFPEDGGPVVFARAAFGELAGFAIGWLAYVSAVFSAAAVCSGLTRAVFAGFAAAHPLGIRAVAFGVATVLALACATGLRFSAVMWNSLTVGKLLPLIALVILAAFVGKPTVEPVATGSHSVMRAALTATFLFQGFEVVPVVAGRARSPERTIPIAVVGSLALAGVLYLLLFRAMLAGVPALAKSEAPMVDTAFAYGGASWARVLGATTSVSALGIALGMMVTTPRYLSALAKGTRLADVGARGVPVRALFATWLLVGVVVALGNLAELFTLSSLAVVLQFGVVAAALLKMAQNVRDAVVGIAALCVAFALTAAASWKEAFVAVVFLVIGAVWKLLSGRSAPS